MSSISFNIVKGTGPFTASLESGGYAFPDIDCPTRGIYTISGLLPGEYSLTVSDGRGCSVQLVGLFPTGPATDICDCFDAQVYVDVNCPITRIIVSVDVFMDPDHPCYGYDFYPVQIKRKGYPSVDVIANSNQSPKIIPLLNVVSGDYLTITGKKGSTICIKYVYLDQYCTTTTTTSEPTTTTTTCLDCTTTTTTCNPDMVDILEVICGDYTTTTTTTIIIPPIEPCDVFFVNIRDDGSMYGAVSIDTYNPVTNIMTIRKVIDTGYAVDIACTDTRIWVSYINVLHEYIITRDPFTCVYNRTLLTYASPDLEIVYADDASNTYIFVSTQHNNILRRFAYINSNIASYTTLFNLGTYNYASGDTYYDKCNDTYTITFTNGKIITYSATGIILNTIQTTCDSFWSIFKYNGDMYVGGRIGYGDYEDQIFRIVDGNLELISSYDKTQLSGSSQTLGCRECTTTTTTSPVTTTTTTT